MMYNKKSLLSKEYLICLLVIVGVFLTSCIISSNDTGNIEEYNSKEIEGIQVEDVNNKLPVPYNGFEQIDVTNFISRREFWVSVNDANPKEVEQEILGGIVPHHNIAAYMIANFFETVAKTVDPEVIILIGPNHFGTQKRYQVGQYNYQTHSGIVECDASITEVLSHNRDINLAERDFIEKEHSLNILMHYIGRYFDDVKVVTLYIGEMHDAHDLDIIADAVERACEGKKCFYVASIDFSHYLPLEQAEEHDRFTRELLVNMDTESIIELGSDYIDCPSANVLLLKILQQKRSLTCKILEHDNMAKILQKPSLEKTTSYFTVLYVNNE